MSETSSKKIAPTCDGSTYNFSILGWQESDTCLVETILGIVSLGLSIG